MRLLQSSQPCTETGISVEFCLLAANSPELFNSEYAGALHSTAQVLMDQKRDSEALRVLNKAAAIYAPSPELAAVHRDRRIC
jgi:hypothetical protein